MILFCHFAMSKKLFAVLKDLAEQQILLRLQYTLAIFFNALCQIQGVNDVDNPGPSTSQIKQPGCSLEKDISVTDMDIGMSTRHPNYI